MSISFISHEIITGNSTGDNAITVPSDCDFLLISYCGYAAADQYMTSASLDGKAAVEICHLAGVANENVTTGLMYVLAPSTGAQTLTTAMTSSSDAYDICVAYWKGVSQLSPVRDSDTQKAPSDYLTLQTITSDAVDCFAYDVVVAVVSGPTADGADITVGSQTLIVDNHGASFDLALGYKRILTGASTTMQGRAVVPSLSVVVLQPIIGAEEFTERKYFSMNQAYKHYPKKYIV